MKGALKLLLVLAVTILLMLTVRTFLFTIYTVHDATSAYPLKAGDREMVNHLSHAGLRKGELVVFDDSILCIGRIEALPGDTITLHGARYLIPMQCCHRCACTDCKTYLINLGKTKALVPRKNIVGRAYRLFNFPLWK